MTALVLVAFGFVLGGGFVAFLVGKEGFVGDDDTYYGRQDT